jgi:hypothetical protein
MVHIPRAMHRPTRQHKNLTAKIEAKGKRSRRRGEKAKRWQKWAEGYKKLCEGAAEEEQPST